MTEAMPIWLMGAFKLERPPTDADFEERVAPGVYLLAWRVGRLGQEASDHQMFDAFERMVRTTRVCKGAFLTAGIGRVHGSMLLGLEACRLEQKASRSDTWRRAPRMSLRLREAAERYAHVPAATELLARTHIRDGELWSRWGLTLTRQHQGSEAVRALRRAMKLTRGAARVTAMRRFSEALFAAGNFDAAEIVGKRALAAAERFAMADERIRAQYCVAHAAGALGRHSESAREMGEVASLATSVGGGLRVLSIRASRAQMGNLALLGEYRQVDAIGARVAGYRSAEFLGGTPTSPGLTADDIPKDQAWDYANLYAAWGEAALAQDRFAEARERYHLMLRLARIHGMRAEDLRANLMLGWVALRTGEIDIAEAYGAPALDALRTEDPTCVPFGACLLAEIALAKGDVDTADRAIRDAEVALLDERVGYAGTLGHSEQITWLTRSVRARIHVARGELEEALAAAEEGIAAIERVRASGGGPWASPRHLDDKVPLYGLAAEAAATLGQWERALRLVESAGTRSVRERAACAALVPVRRRPTWSAASRTSAR